ncbi:MAG TPA: TRAP transporter TatT component family protein, partial [Gammaproteobacteria bacterium]
EAAREHFERAIEISHGHNLGAKVALAENYARLVFDRELHDRVLREVVAADARVSGFTLMNVIAQQRAQELLASADDYF